MSFFEDPIKKATITVDDDLAGNDDGGRLNPVQAREFFTRVRNQMRMNQNARIVPMTGTGIELPQLDISGRVLEPDTNQAGTKRSIDTASVNLYGKRIKASFRVTQGFMEENIEGEDVLDTLADAFARKVANECEQLLFLSNTIGHAVLQSEYNNDRDNVGSTTQYRLDSLYNLFDGMIKQAIDGGHVVNGANSSDLRRLITQAKKALPSQYRNDPEMLRLYMPLDLVENLKYSLGERRTVGGDAIVMGPDGEIRVGGIPVVALPLLSTNPKYVQNITFSGTTAAALDFAYVDEDTFVVTDSTLGATAVTPYVLTTDYVVVETTGTIARATTTSPISTSLPTKITYNTPPLFILTPRDNVIFGINEDFRIGYEYDLDTDTMLVVIRTRIDFKYQEPDAVVLVKNVQDALPSSAYL